MRPHDLQRVQGKAVRMCDRIVGELGRRTKDLREMPTPDLLTLLSAAGKVLTLIDKLTAPEQPPQLLTNLMVQLPEGATRDDKRSALHSQVFGALPPGNGPSGEPPQGG